MRDQEAYRYILYLWITLACCSMIYQTTVTHWSVITWDTYGYYLYLPAFLKYFDWINFTFVEQHHHLYEFSTNVYQVQEAEQTGQKVPTYLYGLSILYLPFYLLGELMARVMRYPADGLSFPYQFCLAASGWVYGYLAFRLLFQLLRQYLRAVPIVIALTLLLIGTNYGYYALAQPASIHVELFFLYAVLIWLSWKYISSPSFFKAAAIGVVVGVFICSRPSEVVCVIIPIALFLASGKTWNKTLSMHLLAASLTVFLICLPQLMLWKTSVGSWLYNPYPHTPDWWNPHILDGLFSYRKGWLVYTPVMTFALFGLINARFYRTNWWWPVFAFLLLNIYIVFTWPMWWYSSSFGMRALIQSYAVLSIPLAFCCSFLVYTNSIPIIRWAGAFLIGGFTALNIFQAWQYDQRILPLDHTTETYYWSVFGATDRDRMLYQYLDHEEIMPDSITQSCQSLDTVICPSILSVREANCVTGPKQAYSSVLSIPLPDPKEENKFQWMRVEGDFRSASDGYDYHHQARLVVSADLPTEEKSYYWREIRLQQLTGDAAWQSFSFDYRVPLRNNARYRTYVWNNGPDQVFLRNLQVSLCPPSKSKSK